jgi:YVTN family beta-propeller protein
MTRSAQLATIALVIVTLFSCSGTKVTLPGGQLPGRLPDGRILLPNGWYLSPAGSQIDIGDLPLNIDISPDERYALVLNSGQGTQTIALLDIQRGRVVQSVPIVRSWLGVRFIEDGDRCVVSGGNDNRILIYDVDSTGLQLADSILIGDPWPKEKIWISGIDVDETTMTLYAAARQNDQLYSIDLQTRSVVKSLPLPAMPYTCLVSKVHNVVYASLWGGAAVAVIDRSTGEIIHTISVGQHPNDMVESPDGSRLFVANANENTVSAIDVRQWKVTETLSSALAPNAPAGSTPNSVALNGDGTRLYIANADNNALAVMDISKPGNARSLGFIPVGWYPTCVRVTGSDGRIIVANGKGAGSKANPGGPNAGISGSYEQYIAHLFGGTVSLIDEPTKTDLQRLTEQVYANARYPGKGTRAPEGPNPIPRTVGEASPIKYVFYIIKENRTYDQVFGDMPGGNGDSTLCLFPERVTPNHHALAREFVLLDNFYADAEVSADGHNWSMGAYATDYVEKTWPTMYGGRGGEYEYEGGTPIVYPPEGYIWDNCRRHGVTYRSYGEFARNAEQPGDSARAGIEGLEGHVAPFFRGWDMDYSDVFRARDWVREFDEFERNGNLPQFQIIRLPNDHMEGTRLGKLTPFAYMAQNDLALGMVVQRISNSRFWKESAIFVIEDDAQNGPDHVDAHRTVALVISPYTKWGFIDSELYSTSSMLRTMELILGLPPMSQFDASATPMYNSFTMTPQVTPYRLREAQVDIYEKNKAGAYGQKRSEELDFAREDAVPDVEFNEILWKSIRGADSPMPSPVRSAFVRVMDEDDD